MQICYLHNFTLVKEVCDSKILFLLHREEQVCTVRIIYRYNQFFTVLASEKRHKFNATNMNEFTILPVAFATLRKKSGKFPCVSRHA